MIPTRILLAYQSLYTHYWLPYVRGATRQYNSSSSSPTSSLDSMDMWYVLMVRQLGSTSIADSVNEWPQRFPQQKRAPKKINDLLNQEYRNTSITGMNYQVSVVGLNMLFHRFAFVRSYLCSAYPYALIAEFVDYGQTVISWQNGHQDSSWKPHVRLAWPIEGGHCQASSLHNLAFLPHNWWLEKIGRKATCWTTCESSLRDWRNWASRNWRRTS